MTHKSKITPVTSPLFCNPLPNKTHITANIDATFSKQFSSTYSILAYLFTAMLYDDTINIILCSWVMFSILMILIILWGLIWAE